MNKVILKLAMFLLPLVIVAIYVEVNLRKIPTSYSYKKALLDQKSNELRTLVLGDSHGVHNFVAEELPGPSLNLSHVSQSLQIHNELLRSYIDKMPQLCAVIVDLSHFSFEYALRGNIDDFRNYFYQANYGFWGDALWYQVWSVRYWSLYSMFGASIGNEIILRNFKENLAREYTESGSFISKLSKKKFAGVSKEGGRGRANFHNEIVDKELGTEVAEALKNMIEITNVRDIKLVLTRSPSHPFYWAYLDQKVESRFQSYVKYSGLTFLDYQKDHGFGAGDFLDNDHLKYPAAKEFTRRVHQDLKTHQICP